MNSEEAKAEGLVEVTYPLDVAALVEVVGGTVTAIEWCKREAERIGKTGRRSEVVRDGDKCAVWAVPIVANRG